MSDDYQKRMPPMVVGIRDCIESLIYHIGDDPKRPGLKETPERIVQSWKELFSGYTFKPNSVFKVFDEPCDEMVTMRNIEFWSWCEHHMLPFYGVAHVGYLPADGKVIGASKMARLVDGFSKKLTLQEKLTREIAEALFGFLNPKGAGCVIEAKHLCMVCRGVQKQQSEMVTAAMRGAFRNDGNTRAEFYQHIGRKL